MIVEIKWSIFVWFLNWFFKKFGIVIELFVIFVYVCKCGVMIK